MRAFWALILITTFLSFANGYFKVPGMDGPGSPNDHLFRGRPSKSDDWDDLPPVMKNPNMFKFPQMTGFYHKMEGPNFSYNSFYSRPSSSRAYSNSVFSIPKTNMLTGLVQNVDPYVSRFAKSERNPVEHSGRMSDGEQRVVGGRDVGDGEIPWQVSLQRKSMKSGKIFHICGGSIINKEWVVTAAHCVALALLSNYRIVSATTNLRDENRIKSFNHDYSVHKVVDVHIHDDYDMFRFRNDIALLRVEPPFEFSQKVQAISLPSPGHTAHGYALASGWGLTQEGVRVTPSRLQAVSLPIVSDSECRQAYGDNMFEKMICAGYKEGGKSVCQGDSGGPLFQKSGGHAVLIGVVSWGVGCARPGKPGVYTEVSHYIGWIEDITGGAGRQNFVP